MRHRYLKRLPLSAGRAALFERVPMGPLGVQTVAAEEALGRITAEPIVAAISAPHYHGAAMDGIAVRAEDTFGATEFDPMELTKGSGEPKSFQPVDTGAALPDWADAVVMIERVYRLDDSRLEIREAARPWQHVRLAGEDVVATEVLLPRGHRVRPADIGAVLAAGIERLAVAVRPKIAILPTGTELIEPGKPAEPGKIIEFNSRVLAASLEECGAEPVRLEPVDDDPALLERRIGAALGNCHGLLVIAGSSAGEHDYTADVISSLGEIVAHGLDVMPGKPAILAVASEKPIIGIPGYPVSAIVIAREIVRPLVSRLLRTAPPTEPRLRAIVPRKLPSKLGLEEIVRVTVGRVGERYVATPLGRGAGVITTMVKANGLVRIPASAEGLNSGEDVDVEILRPLDSIDRTVLATGSHDLALSILEDCVRQLEPDVRLSATSLGSLGGLAALGRGEAHLAGTHLLDPESGTYNLPHVRRLLPGVPVRVVAFVRRQQGLIVRPGNPLGLQTLDDLTRADVRFVNRQAGAGTRVLLDARLAAAGISPDRVLGYEREELTHLAVAMSVASGLADVGLGIHQAAAALDLDFIPLETEEYDLVLLESFAESPLGTTLVEAIRSKPFAERMAELVGYDTSRSGTFKIGGES